MAKVKDPKYPILDRRIARAESVNWVKSEGNIFVRFWAWNILVPFCYINGVQYQMWIDAIWFYAFLDF